VKVKFTRLINAVTGNVPYTGWSLGALHFFKISLLELFCAVLYTTVVPTCAVLRGELGPVGLGGPVGLAYLYVLHIFLV